MTVASLTGWLRSSKVKHPRGQLSGPSLHTLGLTAGAVYAVSQCRIWPKYMMITCGIQMWLTNMFRFLVADRWIRFWALQLSWSSSSSWWTSLRPDTVSLLLTTCSSWLPAEIPILLVKALMQLTSPFKGDDRQQNSTHIHKQNVYHNVGHKARQMLTNKADSCQVHGFESNPILSAASLMA